MMKRTSFLGVSARRSCISFLSITGWGIELDYCDTVCLSWKWTEVILSFLRLHPSATFWTCFLNQGSGVEGCALIFSVRTPKLQLTAEQPLTGECWIPHTKKIPQVQGQTRSPSKMVGGAKSCLESNPIPARDVQMAQTKLCAHQDPETLQRQSQTCLWGFECLLQRCGSAVACHRDRGSRCSRPVSHRVWCKPSWRRLPLTPP